MFNRIISLIVFLLLATASILLLASCGDDDPVTPPPTPITVTDIDGNVYRAVTIGSQVWMAENLKVTHFRNGDPIPNETDGAAWFALESAAYCDYDNDPAVSDTYGRLYNFYVIQNPAGIAPEGWHVPSDDEWKQLEMHLGMSQASADSMLHRGTNEGGRLKEAGTDHWEDPNLGATNSTGFSALPAGVRWQNSTSPFTRQGVLTMFWSTTHGFNDAMVRSLESTEEKIIRGSQGFKWGYSVRCIRD